MNATNIKGDMKDGVSAVISGWSIKIQAPTNYFYAVRVHNAAVVGSSCSWLVQTVNCSAAQRSQMITAKPATGEACTLQLDNRPTTVDLGYSNSGPPVKIITFQ